MNAAKPELAIDRNAAKEALVVFVHGFLGSAQETWANFPALLPNDPSLKPYDFHFWGYPTRLDLVYTITKYFWTDDPNIVTVGHGLRTLLDHDAQGYRKLVLVGHSMGGLVIQAFILEEIARGRRDHLDRLTEVILYGTPSGGLHKASWGGFLKNQIQDMSVSGAFIQDLRNQWKQCIDDRRADPTRAANFRLTLVAGMQDTFVPQESALDPFPFDEKEIVPGNHTAMVKPRAYDELSYRVLQQRLRRGTLTVEQRQQILGQSDNVIARINRVRAAEELGDSDDLCALAADLAGGPSSILRWSSALGLASP